MNTNTKRATSKSNLFRAERTVVGRRNHLNLQVVDSGLREGQCDVLRLDFGVGDGAYGCENAAHGFVSERPASLGLAVLSSG